MATLTGFFGALAGLLAVIGLYGVISYMVAQRRNEIGVRMAMGAQRSDVLRMVMRDAAAMVGIGLVGGCGAGGDFGEVGGLDAVWAEAERSGDVRGVRGGAGVRGGGGEFDSGAKGGAAGSLDRAPRRVAASFCDRVLFGGPTEA